jgi:hypothetical protein
LRNIPERPIGANKGDFGARGPQVLDAVPFSFGAAKLLRIATSSRRPKFTDEPNVTSNIARQRDFERILHCEFRSTKYVKKHGLNWPFV